MNLDLSFLLTSEVRQAIRLFALVGTLLHVLFTILLLRQIVSSAEMITTPGAAKLKIVSIVHVLLVSGILLLIIFY